MTRRRILLVVAALLALGSPAPARADGDPASDVLLYQDAFFPYDPPVSDGAARALLELARRTRAAGWPVKVAIVARPTDLGAFADLYRQPQRYAEQLGREIGPRRLLVVMPNGVGSQAFGARALTALIRVRPVLRPDSEALTSRALDLVAAAAAAAGHRVSTPGIDRSPAGRRPYRESLAVHAAAGRRRVPRVPAAPPSGGGAATWPFLAPVALVAGALAVASLRARST